MISRHACDANLPRHRHADGYVAVVLAGGYVEAGDTGRWHARPGMVVVHGAYEAHRDAFDRCETAVLNLPLVAGLAPGAGCIEDVDAVARVAERDPRTAAHLVAAAFRSVPGLSDWPDLLARALAENPALPITAWADAMALAPASVSRGFSRCYGVSPKRFRLEARARAALGALAHRPGTLAGLAVDRGFTDQAHMSREIAALTGRPPGWWRAKFIQEGEPRPR